MQLVNSFCQRFQSMPFIHYYLLSNFVFPTRSMQTPTRASIALSTALGLFKPVARLLLRHGVAYPAFASALKKVFLDAAQDELRAQKRPLTDSAVSLLSGVHRRDVRELTRTTETCQAHTAPMNMATQVVARWLSDSAYLDADGQAKPLPRVGVEGEAGFDALVASISSDIRPRAVRDELLRLGIAQESADGIALLAPGFAPRQGFAEMAHLLRANAHDHLAAAVANVDEGGQFLEQSIFVDQLTTESAQRLHAVSAKAWRTAFKTVMQEASARYAHDQQHASAEERTQRARFGSYFYAQAQENMQQEAGQGVLQKEQKPTPSAQTPTTPNSPIGNTAPPTTPLLQPSPRKASQRAIEKQAKE